MIITNRVKNVMINKYIQFYSMYAFWDWINGCTTFKHNKDFPISSISFKYELIDDYDDLLENINDKIEYFCNEIQRETVDLEYEIFKLALPSIKTIMINIKTNIIESIITYIERDYISTWNNKDFFSMIHANGYNSYSSLQCFKEVLEDLIEEIEDKIGAEKYYFYDDEDEYSKDELKLSDLFDEEDSNSNQKEIIKNKTNKPKGESENMLNKIKLSMDGKLCIQRVDGDSVYFSNGKINNIGQMIVDTKVVPMDSTKEDLKEGDIILSNDTLVFVRKIEEASIITVSVEGTISEIIEESKLGAPTPIFKKIVSPFDSNAIDNELVRTSMLMQGSSNPSAIMQILQNKKQDESMQQIAQTLGAVTQLLSILVQNQIPQPPIQSPLIEDKDNKDNQ